jgi:hypothetical protein
LADPAQPCSSSGVSRDVTRRALRFTRRSGARTG